MVKLSYKRSSYDYCVYMSKVGDDSYIYMMLCVDDIMIVGKKMCDVQKLKELFSFEFEMNDLDVVKKILGMEIFRDMMKMLFLSQKAYI